MMKRQSGKKKVSQVKTRNWFRRMLVVGLILLLLGGVGTVFLYRFYRYYQSPERFVERARELTAQGDHVAASDQYRRALQRTRSTSASLEIMQAMLENLRNLEPDVPFAVNHDSQNLISLQTEIMRLSEDRQEPAERALRDAFLIAENMDSLLFWQRLRDLARLAARLDDSNLLARKHLNIARLRVRPAGDRTERFYAQIQEEFMALREAGVADQNLFFYLANTYLAQANDMRQDYLQSRRHQLFDQAVAAIDEYVSVNPDDYLARARRLRIMMERMVHTRSPQHLAEFQEQLNELWHSLSTVTPDQREAAVKLAQLYFRVSLLAGGRVTGLSDFTGLMDLSEEEMVRRAIDLLEQVADEDELGLRALQWLVRVRRGLGERDEALAAVERLLSDQVKFSPGPEAILAWSYQFQARFTRLDLWVAEYEETGDQAILATAESEVADLQQSMGEDNPHVRMMDARLMYLRGDYWSALMNFQAAENDLGPNPLSTLFSGLSLARLGESGVAARKLVEFLSTPGQDSTQRRMALDVLAECLIRLRDYERAIQIRNRLLEEEPEWPRSRTGLVETMLVKARQDRRPADEEFLGELEDLLAPLVAELNDEAVRLQTRLYLETGRQEAAVDLLLDYCNQVPADSWGYSTLYNTLLARERRDEAGQWLERTLEKAAESSVLEYLAAAARGEEQWTAYAGNLIFMALQEDSINRKVSLFQFLQQVRRPEEAAAVLRQLQNIAPDDPRILELQFFIAFGDRDWSAARDIADRAVTVPRLRHTAMKWLAQLELARRDHAAALERLQGMLAAGEVDSEVLTLLGVAYRLNGDLQHAQESLEEALRLRPENINALAHLIDVTVDRGLGSKAMEYMRHALRLAPRDQQLTRTFLSYLEHFESSDQALQLRLQMAENNPDDLQNLLHIGDIYLRKGNYEDAAELLQRLRADYPDNFNVVMLTGRKQALQGNFAEGRELVYRFLQQRGDLVGAAGWIQLAELLEQGGADEADIMEAVGKGIELEQEQNPVASRYLAGLRLRQRRAREALTLLSDLYDQVQDSRLLLQKAEAHLLLGEVREARNHINTFLAEQRMTSGAGLLMARIQIAAEENREALNTLNRVINEAPGFAEGYLSRAELLWNNPALRRDGYSVRSDLEKALEINPDLTQVRYMLASWLARNNELAEAIDHLRRLRQQDPDNHFYHEELVRLYMNSGDYDKMRQSLDGWSRMVSAAADESYNIPVLVWRARLERNLGNHDKAVQHYAEAYEKAAADSTVFNEYLVQLLRLDRHREVVELVDDAAGELRQSMMVQFNYAHALAVLGDEEAALSAFTAAFSGAGDDQHFQYRVVERAYQDLARESLGELLTRLEPYDRGGYIPLFRAYGEYQEGELQLAEQRLVQMRRQMDQASPVYGQSLLLLASVYSTQNEHVKAKEVLEEVIKTTPRDPVVLNNLAYEIAQIGDQPFRAVELAEQALQNLTDDRGPALRARVLNTLGYVQHKAGLSAHAETSLERSLRLVQDPVAHLNLGRVYLDQGRPAAALRHLRQAVERATDKDSKTVEEATAMIALAEEEL